MMRRRNILSLSAIIGTTPFIAGCEKISNWLDEAQENRFEWTEDVQLNGGQSIIVKRSARLYANKIAGGGGGSINRGMTLEIISPTQSNAPTIWNDVYVPLLIDLDPETKEWFIVATFFHCDSWYDLGRPSLPYTEYRFKQGQWHRQALSSSLIDRSTNLYIADQKPKNTHLSQTDKKLDLKEHPGTEKRFIRIIDNWPSAKNC